MLTKIISGGQTGADQGGLEGAYALGITTGGQAPKDYKTEVGDQPDLLKDLYGLTESNSNSYTVRTLVNVRTSDGTVMVGNLQSPGTRLTAKYCGQEGKSYICNPTAKQLAEWVAEKNIAILNVAGNRESTNPGIHLKVKTLIIDAFGDLA